MPSLSLKQSVSPFVRPSPTLRVSGGREECDGDPIESAPKIAANPRQTQRHRRRGRHAFASPGKGWDRRRSHSQKTHSLSDGGGRHTDFASGKVGTEERPELISSTVFRKNAGSTQQRDTESCLCALLSFGPVRTDLVHGRRNPISSARRKRKTRQ